jgi:hypothetical protein
MKRLLFAIACVTCFALSTRAATAPATQPSLQEQNRALRQRVDDLERYNDQLQLQLDEKDKTIQRLQRQLLAMPKVQAPLWNAPPGLNLRPDNNAVVPPPWATPSTPNVPSTPNMPRGSVPQQFNGSTFYLVPLAERAQQAPQAQQAGGAK